MILKLMDFKDIEHFKRTFFVDKIYNMLQYILYHVRIYAHLHSLLGPSFASQHEIKLFKSSLCCTSTTLWSGLQNISQKRYSVVVSKSAVCTNLLETEVYLFS